jgi:hypothetical protein
MNIYSVRFIYQDGGAGLYGWSDHSESVKTLEEAIAMMDAPMGKAIEVQVFEVGVGTFNYKSKIAWRKRDKKTGKVIERVVN